MPLPILMYLPTREEAEAIKLAFRFGDQFNFDPVLKQVRRLGSQFVEIDFVDADGISEHTLEFAQLDNGEWTALLRGSSFLFSNFTLRVVTYDEETWFVPVGMDLEDPDLAYGSSDQRKLEIFAFLKVKKEG